ncbi:hypothetical protein, partial [Mesorhizobium sp.]|uniref:hypothetical protein n=1 Tax=Mesorhizobium sp. TaxID=1871066 RepID=UPI00257E7E4B
MAGQLQLPFPALHCPVERMKVLLSGGFLRRSRRYEAVGHRCPSGASAHAGFQNIDEIVCFDERHPHFG